MNFSIKAQSLVAYYPFMGSAADSSGNSFHGVDSNVILAADRHGNLSNAYQFNGNGSVSFPASTMRFNQYTYSLWANPTTLPASLSGQCLLSLGNNISLGDQFMLLGNNYSSPSISGFGAVSYGNPPTYPTPPTVVKNGTLLPANVWYHIVSVRDTVAGKLKLYIDGIKITESTLVRLTAGYDTPTKGNIGVRVPGNSMYFKGIIDDVRIYNYAFTDSAVLSLYNYEKMPHSTGINESTKNVSLVLNVYPNPSTGTINIVLNSNNPSTLQISDIQGRLIHTQNILNNTATIHNIPAGIYFCTVNDGIHHSEVAKFTVTK